MEIFAHHNIEHTAVSSSTYYAIAIVIVAGLAWALSRRMK